jgi:hypothetical protein
MMNLHLILDTSLRQSNQCNLVFHFDKINIECYKKIKLNSLYIQHENDVHKVFNDLQDNETNRSLKPLQVHCSLLNKDYNFLNGKKSDVLAVIHPSLYSPKAYTTNFVMKMDSAVAKTISPCSYMQIKLTHSSGEIVEKRGKFYLIYEFEFSQ